MSTICLVAGVLTKRETASPARELYASDLFVLSRRYAERHADRWFILSARYGLVHPDRVLAPDDEVLTHAPAGIRKAWTEWVWEGLQKEVTPGDTVILLASVPYRQFLVPILQAHRCRVEVPMAGLGYREMVAWLARQEQAAAERDGV
jgi:hypothetical protein